MGGIIMLHGLPGSGKSWLAERLGEELTGSVVLKSVQFRPDLTSSSVERFDEENQKTRSHKDAAYQLMVEESRRLLGDRIVILDGTFHKKHRRDWVYALARECGVPLAVISVSCSERVALERIKKRARDSSVDAVLKSTEAFMLMKKQADDFVEELNHLTFQSERDDVAKVVSWLKDVFVTK